MSSKEQHTDKVIRDKLNQHASPLPAHLWEGIDAVLDEDDKKKRRGAIWWWTGGAALLLLLAISWYVWPANSTNNEQQAEANTTIENSLSATVQETPAATHTDKTNEPTSQINTAKDEPAAPPANADITQADSKLNSAVSKTNSTTDAGFQTSKLNPTNYNPATVVNNTSEDTPTSDNQPTIDRPQATATPPQVAAEAPKLTARSFTGLQLPAQQMLLEDNSLDELDLDGFLNKDPKCARFGKWLKLYFYGDAYFSPDVAFRTLKPKGIDYFEYSQTREETESPAISFSTGLRLSVVSNYGWALRTGVVYSQINEKFDYQNESEQRITITTKYDEQGNPIGQDTTIQYGARFKTTYNHYKMIDIPVIVGYEINFKKFTLSLNSGVYLNILSRQKGDFLSPDFQLVTFTSKEENPYPAFKNRLNLSVYGSVGMMYNITERWQLMLEPHIRYYVDPLTKTNYMIEQSYFSTGLITGLRYKF